MTTSVLYVMLVWASFYGREGGAPATVQNFSTLEKCEFNRPFVELGYKSMGVKSVKTVCLALINDKKELP